MQLQAGLSTANVLVSTNKILNYTMSLIGNIITLLFYIVFSPFICLLMLIYPTKEQGEPEELRRLSIVTEEEDDENTNGLTRLVAHFNRRNHGRLRQLINFINTQM